MRSGREALVGMGAGEGKMSSPGLVTNAWDGVTTDREKSE